MAFLKWGQYSDNDRLGNVYLVLTLLCFAVAVIAIRVISCVRYLDRRHDELTKQVTFDVALDNERICRLEKALAELKGTANPEN